MSYYFKKFERNDLKFCTIYKNQRIAWVKTLNASLFRSNLHKKRRYTTIILKNYIKMYYVYLQSSSILKILIFFNQLHSTYKVTILP